VKTDNTRSNWKEEGDDADAKVIFDAGDENRPIPKI